MRKLDDYTLKPLEEADLNKVLEWRNSDHVKPYMYTDHIITLDEHIKWYGNMNKDPSKEVLLLHFNDKPVGLVNFNEIDFTNSRCYWGFYIGEPSAPKGSGRVLGILALGYMFNHIGIHKVCAEVIETNVRSYHYHQKLGFETEGRLKEHIWKDNRYMDIFSMGLFTEKWAKVCGELMKQWKGA